MARDITVLHPTLQEKIKQLKIKCTSQGLNIGIGECYRTVAEQDALYAKGRTTSGNIVTNAKGSSYSSMHQWYVAFDIYRNDGKGAYYNGDNFFQKVGKIGQSIGLEWGGSWISPVDLPHFQLPNWGSTPIKLKQLYGTPEKFKASWKTVTVKEVDDEMVEKINTKILGENYPIDGIFKDGKNYIGFDAFKKAGFVVTSDGKTPVVDIDTMTVNINGKDVVVKGFNANGTTLAGIREIAEALGHKVSWKNNKVIIE